MATKLLQQAWRLVRLFGVSFVAQWELLPASQQHLDRTAIVSAAVAAAEALYRQVSPQGEARVLSFLASTFNSLVARATGGRALAHLTPADIEAVIKAIEAQKVITAPASSAVAGPNYARSVEGLPHAPVPEPPSMTVAEAKAEASPAPVTVQVAAPVAPAVPATSWPADSPTGPDGAPRIVVGH